MRVRSRIAELPRHRTIRGLYDVPILSVERAGHVGAQIVPAGLSAAITNSSNCSHTTNLRHNPQVLICVYIFLVLGMTADEFFCPALAVISKLLGLSENLAGVTLLAFGNGAPDLFTAFANYEGDSELMYAELFGAAAFIIGTVAAVIVLMRPFTVVASDFRRDVMFFLVACVWIAVAFYNERFTYFEANGAILIYVLYFAVVLVQHFRAKRRIRRTTALLQYNLSDSLQQQLQTLERRHLFRIRGSVDEAKRTDEDASVASDESDNGSVVCGILRGIRPFGADEWREAGWCGRGLLLVRSPIRFGLRLMIPCVDYTLPRNGWNKGLNVLHVLLLPLGFMLLKQREFWCGNAIENAQICSFIG